MLSLNSGSSVLRMDYSTDLVRMIPIPCSPSRRALASLYPGYILEISARRCLAGKGCAWKRYWPAAGEALEGAACWRAFGATLDGASCPAAAGEADS